MTVLEILADVATRLDRAGIDYAVGGSLASSAWGQMRQTNDADIAILLRRAQVDQLLEAFPDPYYVSETEARNALTSTVAFRTVQILHTEEAFKIDLFLLRETEYDKSEIARAIPIEILGGVTVRFYAPENIVIAKLRWFNLGNRVSDRQWNDIVQVLAVQASELDHEYLSLWADHFGVDDLLREAVLQSSLP